MIALAGHVCARYQREFRDEVGRYGRAANAWCLHDNQHLLNWGSRRPNGFFDMNHEVAWLGRVLESSDFPLDRLGRGLELAAQAVLDEVGQRPGRQLADVRTDAAAFVYSHTTFPDQPA